MTDYTLKEATFHGDVLRYADVGKGTPVILVHGLLGSHQSWGTQIERLAQNHRVIAVDLYGCGESDKYSGDYSLSAHAASLRDLMDHLKITTATFVGHSYGGGVIMQFTYLFPDRVAKICLVNAGGLGPEVSALLRAATLPGSELVLPVLASNVVRKPIESLCRAIAAGSPLRLSESTIETWRTFGTVSDRDTRKAFLAITRGVIGPFGQSVSAVKFFPDFQHLDAMVIWGKHDNMIPITQAERLRDVMPKAEFITIDDAGHFPHLDQPRQFHLALSSFLGKAQRAA
ncbi:alpha/beta fold hydrolase [Hoyosella rhizosphaerae]|uniref:Hydrolase n=1 Tax=Hoyosella rhizosphaerae TaxID=1755582 RepID=A0A916U012_9ACTN|nr:alpha/beta fold hydrolase [Hoyosella rhizosphaerae]MBN4927056.1 alpha/beta fold hydrolase [Hoyosella rhizosphaerae]GGC54377.1 hydrolase [Hoyosella rhizosphaerae]